MQIARRVLLGLFLIVVAAVRVEGQGWSDRGYVNASVGGQPQQTFNSTSAFDIYGEAGVAAAGQVFGGGELLDLGAGMRVWKNLALGIAYSASRSKNDASVGVRVPHPLLFGQPREASANVSGIEHTEHVVHLQALWMLPVTSNLQVGFMAGPSFFTVRQEFAMVRAPQDITDPAPYTTVAINNVSVTAVKDSPVGVNVGVDATYLVTRLIGVGGFARYAGATLDLPAAVGMTSTDKVKAGGFQTGGGVRFRF